ncbi:MAG: AAA ATPase [Bacteroidetes bacterium]|nr:MAG: AAA ATPase [Bacteroidota bacterium]
MEPIFTFQQVLLRSVTNDFRRSLHGQISWDQRMIGIRGPRGSGKTTMLLQRLKYDTENIGDVLYVTADHPWFYNHTLFETADSWYKLGGKILMIDEVHKYPDWSVELKNIYDGFPGMQIIFTASSALDIYRGEADLSRRVISYSLPGLSFREYLGFIAGKHFVPFTFEELKKHHAEISNEITGQIRPLSHFAAYLKNGYLPIISEGADTYQMKLSQIINAVVDTDLAYIASYNSGTAVKVKKLLSVIAGSVPFKPNISALARKLDLSRESVYQYIHQLKDAKMLNILNPEGRGISTLQKPEKVFLENTNLAYVLSQQPEKGNIRETFILNQLLNAGLSVYAPVKGDFLVNETTIEVGGKNKTAAQVSHINDFLLAIDDVETGYGNKVPIWLFGFLY